MNYQILKFFTMIKPQYVFNVIEIILLILIVKNLKELFKDR